MSAPPGLFQPILDLRAHPRKLPPLHEVALHWVGSPELPAYPGNVDMGEPFCAACGWRTPLRPEDDDGNLRAIWRFAGRFIDRAHLVDHCFDGSDALDNLIPLCQLCHPRMPSFEVGERAKALEWIRSVPVRPWQFGLCTDGYVEMHPAQLRAMSGRDRGGSFLRRAWIAFLEALAAEAAADRMNKAALYRQKAGLA